jgi:hypothetical protein
MKRDEELYRLEHILKAMDDVETRLFMLREKCGPGAEDRAIRFVKSRKSWFFNKFTV